MSLTFFRFSLTISLVFAACLLICSCKRDCKNCPAFPASLLPYIPNESRLMFFNADGDSLLFRTDIFYKSEQYESERNYFSVGGGAHPYCQASCELTTSLLSSDANQLDYTIRVDNEIDTCVLSIGITSSLPSNDYFSRTVPLTSSANLFGDTLTLSNFVTTTDPRFSELTIVSGRGITKIVDNVRNCIWIR
jgi:hypothetical protein